MKKKTNILDEFSSKLKKVFVEIHDYSYFHSPSEIDKIDKRFIGRTKIIEKFKSILSDSETKTGAYLVTGYRGAGKSSFVSKVIKEVTAANTISLIQIYYVTLLTLSFLLNFIFNWLCWDSEFQVNYIDICIILGCVSVFLSIYLYIENTLREEDKFIPFIKEAINDRNKFKKLIRYFLWDNQIIKKNYIPNTRFLRLLQLIYLVTVVLLLSYSIKHFFRISFEHIYQCTLLSYFIILIVNYIASNKSRFSKNMVYNKQHRSFEKIRIILTELIWNPLKRHFNFSHRSYIKINLGYDDLKEEDVFKLIALSIKSQFKRNIYSFKKYFLMRFSLLFLIYLFALNIYNSNKKDNGFHKFYDYTRQNTYLIFFFPSQNANILGKDTTNVLKEILFSIDSNLTSLNNPEQSISISDSTDISNIVFINNTNTVINKNDKIKSKISNNHFVNNFLIKPASLASGFSDFALNYLFYHGRRFIMDKLLVISNNELNQKIDYHILPKKIDYFFVSFYISLVLLLSLLNRLFGIRTSKDIYKRIKFLNELIDAQVTFEKSVQAGLEPAKSKFTSFFRKEKRYHLASGREIEKELIDIFEELDKIPPIHFKPEFIFIFDELDKVEPFVQRISEEGTPSNPVKNILYSADISRGRQQAILKFLSNMKYFLTSAKAKFIFIAGREMYDASLADVSDRSFYIGSIFHEIIYVDSFLSDESNGKFSDITSLTEEFVCQFLMPNKYIVDNKLYNPSLKDFNKYLINEFSEFNESKQETKTKKIIARQKREKIIFLFEHFIVFLTHLSNGSPKKITKLFESFVQPISFREKEVENYLVVKKYRRNKHFLVFDFYDQYHIGMINYLSNPIILSITNTSKGYSDKLLVSAGFIIDHLFKFHKNAFSWRHIEIAPDIVDIHRTVELRNFITETIEYLSQTHLQVIDTGIYNFKFNKRISNEISFLSKISEDASATFNFTLDESLSTKEFFQSQLNSLNRKYKETQSSNNNNIIHSISHIHMILGDLYFYDEDFNQAINEYMDAIEFLRKAEPKDLSIDLIVLLIRNMLKLGFAFEKRKSYSSAFLAYSQLIDILIKYRNIDLDKFGLVEEKKSGKKEERSVIKVKDPSKEILSTILTNSEIKSYGVSSENSIDNSRFKELINDTITPQTHEIITKLSAFEGVRLIFQPLLAKLFIIEKNQLGGISMIDLSRVDREFDFLIKTLQTEEKYILISDFYTNIGDILFYKNGILLSDDIIKQKYNDDIFKIICEKCTSFKEYSKNFILEYKTFCIPRRKKAQGKQLDIPCFACYYYKLSLLNWFNSNHPEFKKDDKIEDINYIGFIINNILTEKSELVSHNFNSYKLLARNLSAIGDTYLSCSLINDQKNRITLNNLYEIIRSINEKEIKTTINYNHSELILIYYMASHIAFKRANEHKAASFQLIKILYYLKEYFSLIKNRIIYEEEKEYFDFESLKKLIKNLDENIVRRAISSIYTSYDNVHITEINKNKNITTVGNTDYFELISLKKISINVDIEEINLVFEELKYKLNSRYNNSAKKLKRDRIPSESLDFFLKNLSSPYILNESMYNRILRLNFKGDVNYKIFKAFLNGESFWSGDFTQFKFFTHIINNFTTTEKDKEKKENLTKLYNDLSKDKSMIEYDYPEFMSLDWLHWVEYLICDSIKCYIEIINHINTYSNSFMVSHSFIASFHEKLFEWCFYYRIYVQFGHFCKKIIIENKDIVVAGEDFFKETIKNIRRNSDPNNEDIVGEQFKDFIKNLKDKDDESNIVENIYSRIFKKNQNKLKISQSIVELVNEDNMQFVDPSYQIKEAIRNYYFAIETHSEGRTYKKLIERMYLLNDDLNDRLYTFTIANERFKLNNGVIKDKQQRLRNRFPYNKIYDSENYLKTVLLKDDSDN